jgi:hypothetical protein
VLTACYALLRNEEPILPAFLDQLAALFDVRVLVDHSSTDRSVALIRDRGRDSFCLYHLEARGYPQAEVATFFARHIRATHDPDYLFFLDADEFLPFTDRPHMEQVLSRLPRTDVVALPWANICPVRLDGQDIFSEPFLVNPAACGFSKIVLTRRVARDVVVDQGNHSATSVGSALSTTYLPLPLFHIPVQSRLQFTFKILNGNNRLMADPAKLRAGLGVHWARYAQELAGPGLPDDRLRAIALGYGADDVASGKGDVLEFAFPLVASPYRESTTYVEAQARALLVSHESPARAFVVTDDAGERVLVGAQG